MAINNKYITYEDRLTRGRIQQLRAKQQILEHKYVKYQKEIDKLNESIQGRYKTRKSIVCNIFEKVIKSDVVR